MITMNTKTPWTVTLSLFFLFINSYSTTSTKLDIVGKSPEVRGMFVFGSSLVDNGNNNFLQLSAKADFLPYGIDFPYGPSGRFTNGKNVVDLLCDQLKLPLIPASNNPSTKGDKIIHGVNHASGGSGILDDTGLLAGLHVISLSQQIKNFEEVTLPELEAQLVNKTRKLLEKYLFIVGSGGNDYAFNYFLNPIKANVGVEVFTAILTSTLSNHLQRLYNLGARKFVLMSINPIGCSPMYMVNQTNKCIELINKAAHLFNAHLVSLVVDIKKQKMPGSSLIFVNTYKIISDILRDPRSKGFTDKSNPCCEVISWAKGGNGVSCKEKGNVCQNRSLHVYFDGLHPTEAVNVQIATMAYNSNSTNEVYPFNVKKLAML